MTDPTKPIELSPGPDATGLLSTTTPGETQVHEGPAKRTEGVPTSSDAIGPGPLGLLGPYQLLAVAFQDEVGTIYQGFEPLLQRQVTIEVLAPGPSANPDARAQFLREARATAAVVHPYIVTIHAIEDTAQPYVVSEYIPGGNLQQRLDRGETLPVRTVLDLAQQMTEGLAAAHAAGLIHGNLRPAGLLLDEAQHDLKIAGFGRNRVARHAGESGVLASAGLPHYLSPEQARGQEGDQRSDLFSLGSVLYALAIGRPPFRAEDRAAVLRRIADEPPRSVVSLNPEVPEWFSDLIAKLQVRDPEQRPPSAAVAEILREKLGARPLPSAQGPRRRHLGRILVALLLLGLAALGATYFLIVFLKSKPVGEGGLIARVDHPHVRVTIAGRDAPELGVGVHDVLLPPGEYLVKATRNGRCVWEEEVTVAAGRWSEVHVPARIGPVPDQPFVIVGEGDRPDQVFPTLADAVSAAQPGDVIEMHGNGPWETPPIVLKDKPLTIRAAPGFHPILRPEGDQENNSPTLIETKANLVLEGLELQTEGYSDPELARKVTASSRAVVVALEGKVMVTNCRFRMRHFGNCFRLRQPATTEVRNCELLRGNTRQAAIVWTGSSEGTLVLDNCVSRGGHFVYLSQTYQPGSTWELTYRNNTLVDSVCLAVISTSKDWPAPPAEVLISVEASGNVFDATTPLQLEREVSSEEEFPSLDKREELLRKLVRWNESQNVYPVGRDLVLFSKNSRPLPSLRPRRTLQDFLQLWGKDRSDSVQGMVRVHGRLAGAAGAAFDDQSPDSFRLPQGSLGKDRGAVVDLVGAGPGYERFQKTAEYQEWLKRAKQLFAGR